MNNEISVTVFCENVKRLRINNGLSKKKIAELLEITLHSLSLIEKGIIPKRMNFDIVFKLCNNFNVTFIDLFTPSAFE